MSLLDTWADLAGFAQPTHGDGVVFGRTDLETAIELIHDEPDARWVVRTSQRGRPRPSPVFTDRDDAERHLLFTFADLVRSGRRLPAAVPGPLPAGTTVSDDGRSVLLGDRVARFPFAGDAARFAAIADLPLAEIPATTGL